MDATRDQGLCLVAIAGPPALYEKVYAPAASKAGLTPEQATPPDSTSTRAALLERIRSARIVLIDARHIEPFSYFVLGAAAQTGTALLVVTGGVDDETFGLETGERMPFERPTTDDPEALDDLKSSTAKALSQRLFTAESGAPSADSRASASVSLATAPSGDRELSRAGAEALFNALVVDGLRPQTIRDELLAAGAPRSWIELRLSQLHAGPRPGW